MRRATGERAARRRTTWPRMGEPAGLDSSSTGTGGSPDQAQCTTPRRPLGEGAAFVLSRVDDGSERAVPLCTLGLSARFLANRITRPRSCMSGNSDA
jgi:hypothetical protein